MGNKDRYWDRRNAGLCVACGKPAGGKCLCPACGEVRNRATKKWKKEQAKKKAGNLTAEESPKDNPCCNGCIYWRKVTSDEGGGGYCNFFFVTGKTRMSLHIKQYLRLKTAQGRENFLRRMTENCQERVEGKTKRARSPWSKKNGRKKKNG